MRIVIVHADYLEPGGETVSASAELDALRHAGHDVIPFFRSNADFVTGSSVRQGINLFYNRRIAAELGALLARFKPDVVHCNNLFPSLSPSVYSAAMRHGAATVQSLRNYRLTCPAATFFRDGRPCYDCRGRAVALPGISHACYRDSRLASAGVAAMTALHRMIGTWQRLDAYIVLSQRARDLLSEAGLPDDRVHVKFNIVSPEPAVGDGSGGYYVFAGRLIPEKGVRQLLAAAPSSPLPVHVIGDGPLAPEVQAAADAGHVRWSRQVEHAELLDIMGEARAVLAVPLWDEPFGRTVAESLGTGTPLVVTAAGALPEFVVDGCHGLVVPNAGREELTAALTTMAGLDDATYRGYRAAARRRYEELFSPSANVRQLEGIYRSAIESRNARGKQRRSAVSP